VARPSASRQLQATRGRTVPGSGMWLGREVLPQRGHRFRSHSHARRRPPAASGSRIGTTAPIAAPLEVAALQEKWATAEGAMPFAPFGCPSEGADLQERRLLGGKTLSFWGQQWTRLPRYVSACVTPGVVVVSSSASETPRWARTNGSAWRAESSGGQSRG
jgi:hypothetical protein